MLYYSLENYHVCLVSVLSHASTFCAIFIAMHLLVLSLNSCAEHIFCSALLSLVGTVYTDKGLVINNDVEALVNVG